MTRGEWLDRFETEITRELAAPPDALVALFIARGGTENDLPVLTALWEAELNALLPPLRARAVRALQTAPDAAITWD